MDVNRTQKELVHLEWLKTRMKTIWTSTEYCALCLSTAGEFISLSMELSGSEESSSKPLKDVVNYVFNFVIDDFMPSEKICEQCAEKTIQAYLFITNTKKMFHILNSCISDMYSKVDDLNNTLNKDEGYEDANVMIVVEYDSNTYRDITELASSTNAVLTDKPKSEDKNPVQIKDIACSRDSKENKVPVAPTLRIVKHPRTNKNSEKRAKHIDSVPVAKVSSQGGNIVIEPISNAQTAPRFTTYSCNSCSDIFTTYRTLKEHEKAKHNSVIYKCRYCNKVYNTQQYLDVHYLSSHKRARCRYCHDVIEAEKFNMHLKDKHLQKVYSCPECNLVYYTQEKLNTHLKASHSVLNLNSDHQCVMCLKSLREIEINTHKCKFSCLECPIVPCIHYSYLMSFRDQILNHSGVIHCIDCDFTTKRKEQLIAHVNREHLDYHPFTCGDCGTQFYTKQSLKSHIMQFHQDLKCQYCDSQFKNSNILKSHRLACKSVARMYDCEKCVASFDTSEELDCHNKANHTEFVYPCSLCKKEFSTEDGLDEHKARVHSGIQYKKRRKIIECTICNITFKNIKEMLEHEKSHASDEIFPCKDCPKTFSSLKQIYVHKQKHYSQRKHCPGCNKPVATSFFSQHKALCFRSKHIQYKNVCKECGKSFHLKSSLKAHQQLHKTAPNPCPHCGKLIKPSSMKSHLELKHAQYASLDESVKAQLLKCPDCEYVARKKADFENHVNKIHLKIKPYHCDLCSREFCGKSRLAEHMRTHTSINTCLCPLCGKKFANKVCLKMHVRRHTNENPYECNICYEKFRSSSIMKTHRLKKHQDKTIACPICDAMYHLVAEMRFHVKKVHWKSSEPFDYKKLVGEEFYHLFQDRRLQKLGDDSILVENEEYIICNW